MKRIIFLCFCCIALWPAIAGAQVNVTGSAGVNGTYATLSAAFTAINGGAAQTGNNILLTITADILEPSAVTGLVYRNWTSLTIEPSGDRYVGAGVSGPHAVGFNGARFVTIDGLNTGGNRLTIISGQLTPALVLYNGASNNTIRNTSLVATVISATSGTLVFSNTTSGGVSNNTVDNCDIYSTVQACYNLIYSNGTAAAPNRNNSITNCLIHDNFNPTGNSNAILLDANNDQWNISNNRFYQSSSRIVTGGNPVYTAININGCTGDNFTINSNYIGGSAINGTGTTSYSPNTQSIAFKGIVLANAGPASASFPSSSSVRFNQIRGINVGSSKTSNVKGNNIFIGIEVNNGATTDAAMVKSNIIGASTSTNHIRIDATSTSSTQVGCYGIYNRSAVGNYIDSNYIAGISMAQSAVTARTTDFSCIYSDPASNSLTSISYNTIGNPVANNITSAYTNATLYGIEVANTATSGTSYSIRKNLIRNMQFTGTSANPINYPLAGIIGVSGGDQLNIYENTIHNLSYTTNFTNTDKYVAGIRSTGQTGTGALPNYIYSNVVYDLSAINNSNGESGIIGMSFVGTGGTHYVYNNIISIGSLCLTNVIGINISAATPLMHLYNNSVYISGADIGSLSTCLRKYSPNSVISARNNIFYNNRPGNNTSAFYSVNALTASGSYVGENNFWYSAGDYLASEGSNYYLTLNDLQTTLPSPNAEGPDSKSGILNLFDGLYNVVIYPELINAGMDLSAAIPPVTTDITGLSRGHCFDIGAYEYHYLLPPEDLTWTGSINDKWCEPCNWDKGTAPDSTHNAYVNALPALSPVVDATGSCVSPLPEVKDLHIQSGATVSVNASALEIFGDLNNSGTFSTTGGSVGFTSSLRDQNINSSAALQLNHLYIRGLGNRKFLNVQTTVNNYTSCATCVTHLVLGTNDLYINGNASGVLNSHIVTNSTGMVIHRNVLAASRLFPIGHDETHFNPVSITNGHGRDYSAKVQAGISPAGNTNPLLGVNRTWTLNASTPPPVAADVRFYYYNTDVNGSCNPHSNMYLGHYYTTPLPIWNVDQGNQSVTVGAPNSVLFNISNWTSNDPFIVGNLGLVLAINNRIQLSGRLENNTALLEWRIDRSNDVARFDVLRSADGIHFETTGRADAVNSLLQYYFTDMNAGGGDHYYRIRLWNARGEMLYSNIILLKAAKHSMSIQPALVTGITNLQITSPVAQKINYHILNAEGKRIQTMTASLFAGNNTIPVDATLLPAGKYFIRIDNGKGITGSLVFIRL